MRKRAKTDRPEDTGKSGVHGISRRAFLRASAVGTGAAAAAGGMSQVAGASVEGPRPARHGEFVERPGNIRPAL
ncbi:MAG: twin-arginine translocation signal domain-containing protein [Planctomycetota bacterium]